MAATSTQTLFDEAQCFSCLGAVSGAQTMRISLLTQISGVLGETMTTQELIDEGQCYLCIPGVSLADAVELALLSNISDEIGAGVGSGNISGDGSPIGVVTPTEINQQYRDDLNDTYWWATGLTNADWHQYG